ncbi:MAG: tetratricopeptide repeat protein [Planctomycetota bacterium]|nr:MAG: tetratricopeptide repeat protein [Planctomycetota bacterium]
MVPEGTGENAGSSASKERGKRGGGRRWLVGLFATVTGLVVLAALVPLAITQWESIGRERARRERAREHAEAGERALEAGDVERAVVAFGQAQALDPDDRTLAARLVRAQARALIEGRLAIDRQGALALVHRVELEIERGGGDEALLDTARGVLARLLDDRAAAQAWLRRALEADAEFAPAYTQLGRLALEEGKFEDAVGQLRKAIGLDASAWDARQALGIALHRLGRDDEAVEQLRQAMDNDTRIARDPETLLALGEALLANERYEQAIEPLTRALQRNPDLVAAHRGLGMATFRLGRYREAIGHLTEAFRRTRDISSYFDLGVLYQTVGDYRRAAQIFNEVIANAPRFAQAYFRLATVLVLGGQPEAGRQVADRYFQLVGDAPAEHERVQQLRELLERAAAGAPTATAQPAPVAQEGGDAPQGGK